MSDGATADLYRDKPASYFGNSRADIVALLPTDASSAVLELGCGAGGTGRAALAAGKAGRYVGLELSEAAAAVAREHLSEVIVGDVGAIDLSGLAGRFDALIISEVLEHLVDPWGVLARLAGCVKPGGFVAASSPNIANRQLIRDLMLGRFDYAASGVMDQTHLRWFTPASYRALFEGTGFAVVTVGPIRRPGPLGRAVTALSGGRLGHLFTNQIMLTGRRR